MIRIREQRGMVLIAVVGAIFFVSLIFMFMVKRVRQEAVLTDRVSINERLYQTASAIGRFAVRRLQRDFETREADVAEKILQAVFQGKTDGLKSLDYTSAIKDQEVVGQLLAQCGDQYRELTLKVTYDVDLGPANPFAPEMPGLQTSPFEKRGFIDVVVTVSHRGVTKNCRIRKEFLLVRLLAPPFHRFSLFARRGAELLPSVANGIQQIDEDGEVQGRAPLILLNRLIRNKGGKDFDFNRWPTDPQIIIKDANSFVQNGWIYLGGRGASTDLLKNAKSDGSLILNVCTGAKTDLSRSQFGEYFHFHFAPDSNGWQGSQEWFTWLNNNIPNNTAGGSSGRLKVTFVDYGHYTGLKDLKFPSGGAPLFQDAIAVHKQMTGPQEVFETGNSLHLYGTPGFCTPTLIFGKVKRRYLRTFAFYFSDAQRLFPLRYFGSTTDWDNFLLIELGAWLTSQTPTQSYAAQLVQDMIAKIPHQTYLAGSAGPPPLCRLYPLFRDWEPYMMALKNIARPNDPAADWATAVPTTEYLKNDPKSLYEPSYRFDNDKNLHFTGTIQSIAPGNKYLRDKTSYFIPEGGSSGYLKLSTCKFFMDRFVQKKSGKNLLFLNQIVGFKNNIEIDIPLEVIKGGIIYSEGSIRVTNPVINPYIANPPRHPDGFGYLTLVSPKAIALEISGGSGGGLPQFHGFLVCMSNANDGQIEVTRPVHIIGGVAVDKIDRLAEIGGIIEWGFEPDELWDSGLQQAKDLGTRDFYGIVLGPRDAEIVGEE